MAKEKKTKTKTNKQNKPAVKKAAAPKKKPAAKKSVAPKKTAPKKSNSAQNDVLFENGPLRAKVCRRGTMLYSKNDVFVGRSLDCYGEYGEAELMLIEKIIRPGNVAVDIGANIGVHTVAMASMVGPKGAVLAIEPLRFVHHMLCANAALNGLINIRVQHAAAGSAPGTITVPLINYEAEGNLAGIELGSWTKGEQVRVITIDGMVLARCDFMKVFGNGMEAEVVAGAKKTIEKYKPILFIENDRREKSPALLAALLKLDYRLYWVVGRMFNANNFFGESEDVLSRDGRALISISMLCVPRSGPKSFEVSKLPEAKTPDDWWHKE